MARSSTANHRAPTLVMAFMTNGCPTASPTVASNTRLYSSAKMPRMRAKTPVSVAPMPIPTLSPYVSITHDAGTEMKMNTTMNIIESNPMLSTDTP